MHGHPNDIREYIQNYIYNMTLFLVYLYKIKLRQLGAHIRIHFIKYYGATSSRVSILVNQYLV